MTAPTPPPGLPRKGSTMTTPADPVSPCCQAALTGGPVVYRCTGCGHDAHGSVIDRRVKVAA